MRIEVLWRKRFENGYLWRGNYVEKNYTQVIVGENYFRQLRGLVIGSSWKRSFYH